MIWLLAIGLALATFAAMVAALGLPRTAWTSVLAVLALGLAGYAWQGRPGLPGAPSSVASAAEGSGEAMVDLRRAVVPSRFHSRSNRLLIADALARRNRPEDAATMLRGAIREAPRDAEAWLALANALTAAADGRLTPASQYAYRRAETLSPQSPGVPFFVGIAELQANRFLEARMLWGEALRRAPEGSQERTEIEARVTRLDEILRQIVAEQAVQEAQPRAE